MDNDDPSQGPRSPALRDALRLLGNPYASLQTFAAPELRTLTERERAYVRLLENQYAPLSIGITAQGNPSSLKSPEVRVLKSVPKAEFQKECRRIFGQYIPAVEKGRLRHHHRGFISRNVGRAPGIRAALLSELRKYDLGDLPGFQARFNRERNPFTEAKLKDIELAVSGRKK
jgi:hypothetical protein